VVRKVWQITVLCIAIFVFAFVTPSFAFYDDFQSHPNDNITNPEENFGIVWSYLTAPDCADKGNIPGCEGYMNIKILDINNKKLYLQPTCVCKNDGYYCDFGYCTETSYAEITSPYSCSNHWIMSVNGSVIGSDGGACTGLTDLCFRIYFYNSSGGLINKTIDLEPYLNNHTNLSVWEFVRSGNEIHLYINGEYICNAGGEYPEPPCKVRFWFKRRDRDAQNITMYIDDIGTYTGRGVVNAIPHNWYILRHWDAPELSGLLNDENVLIENHRFTISYTVPYIATNPCDEIRIKHFTTNEVINVTPISERYGVIFYNFTKLLFHQNKEDDKYGLYLVELMREGSVIDYDYFFFTWDAIDKPKGTIAWDKDSYASGSVAKIHTNLTDPDFSTYVYKGFMYDVYGNKKEEWTITTADEWHEVDLNGYDAGVYYAILKIRNKNTGFEWDEAWDVASVSEEVDIEGVSYDAKSETVLGGVYVNAIQNYEDHETTTNITTGEYNISKLSVDIEIQMNASKANYTHNNFSFTPLQNGLYEINLYLLPDTSHISITPPAVVGIVSECPFHQAISNATVNIWKDGWNSSTTTNSMGYFEFVLDNTSMNTSTIENETFNSSEYDTWVQLANTGIVPYTEKVTNTTDETPYVRGVDYEMDYVNGRIKVLSTGSMQNNTLYHIDYEKYDATTFFLNATKEGYKESEVYTFTVNPTEIKYVYPLLYGLYNITVRARDAGTHATIFNFKATLNDGEQTRETSSGWLNFTGVEYGIHKVEVGADGYYSAIEYVYVYGDVEKIVYLTPLETAGEQGVGISYPPHQVEFACVDMFGNPLANIYVEATPISTTTGSWDWLLKLFGIRNESISYYTNQTLNGTTDSRGAITFVMMENVEYEVNFRNESLGINKTIRIYPKADHYTVILTPVTSSIVSSEDYITFNLSYEIIDEEEINLSLVYSDALGQTQNLTFFVYNSTTLLYSQNFTNTSNISASYTVPYKAGEEYMWGYSAFHSRFGEMGRSRILRIAWFLDLGISRTYCTWIAIAIILFLTAMFSFTTVKFGYVAIPIISLIFAFIGWLPNISIIIITLCLGILAYMSKREKEVGV